MSQIFLSYRREDSADVCGRINDWLAQHFGQDAIFTDVDSIPLGIDFQQYIDEQVGKCDIFLAVIGRDWLSVTDTDGRPRLQQPGDFVRIEIESALQRNIPVIPLLVRRATMPSGDDLPDTLNELATRNGMPIRPNPDFHRDMERLINGIEQHLSRQSEEAINHKSREERKRPEDERIEQEKVAEVEQKRQEAKREATDEKSSRAHKKSTREAEEREHLSTFTDNLSSGGKAPVMVVIPPGSFEMGSSVKEEGRGSDEGPQRKIWIKSFALGKYEVTFAEYDRFAAATGREKPSDERWGRDQRPVINVGWNDATAYARWLSDQTGKKYRLPTEAEWEYAARSGNMAPWFWGDNEDAAVKFAWFSDNSGERTHPVGEKKPNDFGLHDMAGNVWEWNQDCYMDSYEGAPDDGSAQEAGDNGECARRVLRGGSWFLGPRILRSAYRLMYTPDNRDIGVGFRLARTL